MRSIMQDNWQDCYFLTNKVPPDEDHPIDTWQQLQEHHVFGGAKRKWSEKYGLKVHICCVRCHNGGPSSVHKAPNTGKDKYLKEQAQKAFEVAYANDFKDNEYKGFTGARAKFVEVFGKNYL